MHRINLFAVEAEWDADDPDGYHAGYRRLGLDLVLLVSTKHEPSVAVYPDSDKIGVWPGDKRDNLLVRRESIVDYSDRE